MQRRSRPPLREPHLRQSHRTRGVPLIPRELAARRLDRLAQSDLQLERLIYALLRGRRTGNVATVLFADLDRYGSLRALKQRQAHGKGAVNLNIAKLPTVTIECGRQRRVKEQALADLPPSTVTPMAWPSGRQYRVGASGYQATVVEVSGGLRELTYHGRPIIDGYLETEMCHGARGQLLIPWPNRIDAGRYRFGGQDQQLAITEPSRNCAIHGLTRWANWTAEPQGPDRLTMRHRLHAQPGWPHIIDLAVDYTFDMGTGLIVTVTATNAGNTPAPYGNGAHPYLRVGTDTIDVCQLELPANTRVTTDERGIPNGHEAVEATEFDFRQPRLLGAVKIDDAFRDLRRDANGRAWTTLHAPDGLRVSLWVDESYRWLQIFTGDNLPREDTRRRGLAVEPMTCPANSFVNGEGLITLDPGESAISRWGIVAHGPGTEGRS